MSSSIEPSTLSGQGCGAPNSYGLAVPRLDVGAGPALCVDHLARDLRLRRRSARRGRPLPPHPSHGTPDPPSHARGQCPQAHRRSQSPPAPPRRSSRLTTRGIVTWAWKGAQSILAHEVPAAEPQADRIPVDACTRKRRSDVGIGSVVVPRGQVRVELIFGDIRRHAMRHTGKGVHIYPKPPATPS